MPHLQSLLLFYFMYLCYIDESGTPQIPGNSAHYVLAGIALPIWHWRDAEYDIRKIKTKYSLEDAEIHVGWILRPYSEQNKISDFDKLPHDQRRFKVEQLRNAEILKLQKSHNLNLYKQTKKNYKQTQAYIHLTYMERCNFIEEVAITVKGWGFARIFAECIDKLHFNPSQHLETVDEQAFEQLVSRFEQFLLRQPPLNLKQPTSIYGILIHDNNETVANKHTNLMKHFHKVGTLWTKVNKIIETPLFVDSTLTSMIQIADLCAFSLRRYLETTQTNLFDHLFPRADRIGNTVVGVRHYTNSSCTCKICTAHRT